MQPIELGRMRISKVFEMESRTPMPMQLPGVSSADLQRLLTWYDPGDDEIVLEPEDCSMTFSVHSFVIEIDGLTVLIDTCDGNHKNRSMEAVHQLDTPYLDGFARIGIAPEDIDLVMCTHLHFDHVGWNTRLENGKWVPTFPNARYVMGRDELSHWQAQEAAAPGAENHGAYADSVLPVLEAGLAEPVDDGVSVAPGLEIVPLRGHSPGQIGLELSGRGAARALFCGDALHSPVHVFRPGWSTAFCHDPAQAAQTRRALLDRAAEEDLLLLPAHLRRASGMRIARDGAGHRPTLV